MTILNHIRYCGILATLLTFEAAIAQNTSFEKPLQRDWQLTGNYAEIRPNHFHAGIDLATDPIKHLPIYAVADGFVSRIKISTYGYGKVIYITHPNGFVSVYAHQYAFSEKIKKMVTQAQSINEAFEIELTPRKDELPVKKGELIGYSGNTGSSTGPHLHFEIRDEISEEPYNPLLFYNYLDTIAPVLKQVVIYENKWNGDFAPSQFVNPKLIKDTLKVSACFALGIEGFDYEILRKNKNQVAIVEIRVDSILHYQHVMDRIHFDQHRHVNIFADAEIKKQKKATVQKCFIGKNNSLPIYKVIRNQGIIQLEDDAAHCIEITLKDVKNLTVVTKIWVRRKDQRCSPAKLKQGFQDCLHSFQLENEFAKINVPASAVFDDYLTPTLNRDTKTNLRSQLISFGDENAIINTTIEIAIKSLPEDKARLDKLCLVSLNKNGTFSYAGGEAKEEWMTANVKSFGLYAISIDTIAPSIVCGSWLMKINKLKQPFKFNFNVADNLSGIDKFRLEIDGKWVNAEYEHKASLIFYQPDVSLASGEHTVKLIVMDKKKNESVLEKKFIIN